MAQPLFLTVTVIGVLAEGAQEPTMIKPSRELYLLEKIGRLQPQIKSEPTSSAIITFVEDHNLPKGKLILQETFGELTERLRELTL